MLNYLAMPTHLDIAFAIHQSACFCADPKVSHDQAVKCICHYLARTPDKDLFFTPDPKQSLNYFVDDDFANLMNFSWSQGHTF